jgi:hypothetical protein
VYAGLASARGRRAKADELLRDAAERCEAAAMRLYAAAARYHLGGEACARAEEWMRGQQIARPERVASWLVPVVGAS